MKRQATSLRSIIGLLMIIGAARGMAATPLAANPQSERVTGNLVSVVTGARTSQPFILTIDRYATDAELQRLGGVLAAQGPYTLRDTLWTLRAGTLSVGGGLGYPVSVALSEDTPTGRTVRVIIDRPLSRFEVAHSTRSSKYPFGYLELNLDRDGRGQGVMFGAAQLRAEGSTVAVKSLGAQPFRLLAVRAD
jgi:hypothetical protein